MRLEPVGISVFRANVSMSGIGVMTQSYDPNNLYALENRSTAPIRKRQREITPEQKLRIIYLRKKYLQYSKIKLAKIYERQYQEPISSWKI